MKQACLSIVAVMSLLGSTQRWAAAADALPPPSPPPPSLPSIEEFKERELRIKTVVSRVLPAVVAITSGTGSGVIINEEGLILTAAHVTDAITENGKRKEVVVVLPDGQRARGEVLGANRTCDAAMVRIIEPALKEWPCVEIGTSDDVAKGSWVVALGQPGGFEDDRSPPVRVGRVWGRDNFGAFFTDCTLIGGDSGGPLFDLEGKLIGIHSSIGGPLTVNRHIGIDNFHTDWARMLKGESWGELILGDVDPKRPVMGAELDRERAPGVTIRSVVAQGPAAMAGLQPGDVITHFGGVALANHLSFIRLISRQQPGDQVQLRIVREGAPSTDVQISLLSRQTLRQLDMRLTAPAPPKTWLGIDVEDAPSGPGAIIQEVAPDSPAARAGLQTGDELTSLDGTPLGGALGLAKSLAPLEPGAVVSFKLRRGGAEIETSVTLTAPLPPTPAPTPAPTPDSTPDPTPSPTTP